jgi:hypothetical protein
MAIKDKNGYTAKERKELASDIKLTDEVCATCEHGRRKDKGSKYACIKGGSRYPFETCESYERNSYLQEVK